MLWVLLILTTLFGTQGKILNKCLNATVNLHNTSLVLFGLSSEHNFFFGTYKFDCTGAGIDNSTKGYWIITDSDGINVTLNAKVVHTPTSPRLNNYVWKATLNDGPTKYKSPYTYQCVVSNDCGLTVRSNLVTGINYPTPPPTGPTPTPKDIDECSSNPCHANATCNNTARSYMCACEPGYSGDGFNCTDIDDECSTDPCHASATCNNTIASFMCNIVFSYFVHVLSTYL